MLPVHPGVHMSETDVPQQAVSAACCGQMSIGQGEHRMSGSSEIFLQHSHNVKKTAEAVFFGEGISSYGV